MYFFRTFKKSTAPYKVHNVGLRYIKKYVVFCAGIVEQSVGARNRLGIGLSHRPARLHRLSETFLAISKKFKNQGSVPILKIDIANQSVSRAQVGNRYIIRLADSLIV